MVDNEKTNVSTEIESRKDKFKLAKREDTIHDTKFETKPVTYLQDCLRRFAKNKASVVGAIIILFIVLFAVFEPVISPMNQFTDDQFTNGQFADTRFNCVTPKLFDDAGGFWDGTKEKTIDNETYTINVNTDSNHNSIVEVIDEYAPGIPDNLINLPAYKDAKMYKVRIDTYAVGCVNLSIPKQEYEDLVKYEIERGIYGQKDNGSIMKPLVDVDTYIDEVTSILESEGVQNTTIIGNLQKKYQNNDNYYFKLMPSKNSNGKYSDSKFVLVRDVNNNIQDIYKRDNENNLVYYEVVDGSYNVRVDYYDYITFKYGIEPIYIFGSNEQGQDILLRLALGVRFSLLLGLSITLINFIIGLIWGSISGYYGGKVDLLMERFTDIIANIPTIIIMTITNIQLVNGDMKHTFGSTGAVIVAIFIAFIYNGWVGVAGTTRMQFYRFKGQEYVLASRTLGAKDKRLIFKHILPNATGTLVTRSVLMVPSVIFSESSLSYLGIINFQSSGICSIGAMLNEGKNAGLQENPHVLLFPALIITLLMISFNLFGNGLRDAFNTTLRGSED